MTNEQREKITALRHQGFGYTAIAKSVGLNRSYFGKIFKEREGQSPQAFLLSYRMAKAADILQTTDLSVAETGVSVGYQNQLHFSRAFKGVYGIPPREWRNKNRV